MKRLCIYVTYDNQNIVDHYIGYMLKELRTCVNYLIIVCNETRVIRGKENLEKYANQIFYRENRGYDAGGFKDALCNLAGWNIVLNYDELLLVNDSIFGPFKPMKDIFTKMDDFPVDFWGLAKRGITEHSAMGYIPEHLQTYFIVIRSKMLHCQQFKDYWEQMPWFTTRDETVRKHELQFTNYFSSLGFSYTSLADTEINDSLNTENNYTQYAFLSYELIKKRNFPFLKKQGLINNTLFSQTQEHWRQSLNYIKAETSYDVNLIWDNLIRTLNMTDLQHNLCLRYIISSDEKILEQRKEIIIAVFISYVDSSEYVLEYLDELKQYYTIKIFFEIEKYSIPYINAGYQCVKIKEKIKAYRSLSNYSLVCIIHDADLASDIQCSCIGKSYFYNIWDNLVKNKYYVNRVLERFAKETKLGFLTTPQPNFSNYFGDYGIGWNNKFDEVQRILKNLNINCPISIVKPPFRLTNDFWIRGSILKQLTNLESKECEYLPYLWIYFSQHMGYYSGVVESTDFASMDETNMQYYLNRIAYQIRSKYQNFNTFDDMEKIILTHALQTFCQKYSRIFIYGIGEVAKRYKDIILNVEAYIVSDGHRKEVSLDGVEVKYLSELSLSNDCGVIICVKEKHLVQIIPLLHKHGIKNYIFI